MLPAEVPPAGDPTPTTKPPDPFFAQMQAMLGGMESRLGQATASLQASVTGQLGDLKERVNKNEDRLETIYADVGSLVESKIDEGLRRLNLPLQAQAQDHGAVSSALENTPGDSSSLLPSSYASALGSCPSATGPAASFRTAASSFAVESTLEKRNRHYWKARKTLRLRPIADGNETELVKQFMKTHLKLDLSTVERLGPLVVTRVPFGPKSKFKEECMVLFDSVEARDIVRGAASNLAGSSQDVGIRLEIPHHLRAAMRALQSVSFDIKTKHKDARRNILYDDDRLELVLDFSVGEGKPWRRLYSDQAMARRKGRGAMAVAALDEAELDEILGGGVEESDEEGVARGRTRPRMGFGGDP